MDILRLYTNSRLDQPEPQEIAWLESIISKYPWFSLPHTILAKYHHENHSTIKDRSLQKAAAYSLNRGLLKDYILGESPAGVPDSDKGIPRSEEKGEPIAEPHIVVETEAPEQASDSQELKSDEAAETVEIAADIPTSENEGENQPIDEPAEVEAETPTELQVEDTDDSIIVSDLEEAQEMVDASEAEEVEAPLAETEAAEEEKEAAEEEKDAADAVTETEAVPTTDQIQSVVSETPIVPANTAAPVVDPKAEIGKINWYLETRVGLRAAKYVRLAKKIQGEIAVFAAAFATETNNHSLENNKIAEAAEVAAKEINTVATPISEPSSKIAEEKQRPIAEKEEKEENEYQIGSFSGFTFLTESVAEGDVEEIDTEIIEAEAVEATVSEEGGETEIIFEERDRVIEITVTPEQLAKYFRGQNPNPKALAKDAMEPFELTLEQEKTENAGEKPSKEKVDEIIDRFIETDPTISNPKEFKSSKGNLAAHSSREPDDLVTETLAKIHAMQGNYAKATKIYKKLSLLFPEKSDYFADQIKNLKK